jgi:nucleoside recognition membrane protein YjiH
MLYKSFWDAITFAQKIVAYVISIATVSLVVATYTPLFDYLGAPFAPILSLLQLPNAVEIAPALLVSIAEIALPVIIISGGEVAAMSVFFICTLSTVQIIFFF